MPSTHIPSPLQVVVLAAGKGTRMKSRLPKVLHRLAGRPMLGHVLAAAAALDPERVVAVTGHGAADVAGYLEGTEWASARFDIRTVVQEPQLGTGHAVQQALPELAGDGTHPHPVRRRATHLRHHTARAGGRQRAHRARPSRPAVSYTHLTLPTKA